MLVTIRQIVLRFGHKHLLPPVHRINSKEMLRIPNQTVTDSCGPICGGEHMIATSRGRSCSKRNWIDGEDYISMYSLVEGKSDQHGQYNNKYVLVQVRAESV